MQNILSHACVSTSFWVYVIQVEKSRGGINFSLFQKQIVLFFFFTIQIDIGAKSKNIPIRVNVSVQLSRTSLDRE